MMTENRTLAEIKNSLRNKYLGQSGIHAFGISERAQAIRVYITAGADEEVEVTNAIRREAEPFGVQIVKEPPPKLQR